jgi:uncharacterized coiled-coil protein SlyX
MQPRIESRISSLEKRATTIEANIEELSSDTAENFRSLRQDIKHLADDIEASFKQSAEYQVKQEQMIEARFDKIEATMATKEDVAALKATQSEHSKRFDKLEATQSEQGQKLDQILQLLQSLGKSEE